MHVDMGMISHKISWYDERIRGRMNDPSWENMLRGSSLSENGSAGLSFWQKMCDDLAKFGARYREDIDNGDVFIDFPDLENLVHWQLTWS